MSKLQGLETRPTYRIGYDDKFEAALPLSASEAGVATQDQRTRIAADVRDAILAELEGSGKPQPTRAWLVEQISRRSGLDHANASFVVPYDS
jgi:hypothetical protein